MLLTLFGAEFSETEGVPAFTVCTPNIWLPDNPIGSWTPRTLTHPSRATRAALPEWLLNALAMGANRGIVSGFSILEAPHGAAAKDETKEVPSNLLNLRGTPLEPGSKAVSRYGQLTRLFEVEVSSDYWAPADQVKKVATQLELDADKAAEHNSATNLLVRWVLALHELAVMQQP
ncbi:MAG TPA: hypothetical protein VFO38_00280 [Candidatus Saccharimonadales bacterium]|nr:hypothetical protein [Candidatus Saccharimonadales bacterium]